MYCFLYRCKWYRYADHTVYPERLFLTNLLMSAFFVSLTFIFKIMLHWLIGFLLKFYFVGKCIIEYNKYLVSLTFWYVSGNLITVAYNIVGNRHTILPMVHYFLDFLLIFPEYEFSFVQFRSKVAFVIYVVLLCFSFYPKGLLKANQGSLPHFWVCFSTS